MIEDAEESADRIFIVRPNCGVHRRIFRGEISRGSSKQLRAFEKCRIAATCVNAEELIGANFYRTLSDFYSARSKETIIQPARVAQSPSNDNLFADNLFQSFRRNFLCRDCCLSIRLLTDREKNFRSIKVRSSR